MFSKTTWGNFDELYCYTIEYKPGPDHANADVFSRLRLPECATDPWREYPGYQHAGIPTSHGKRNHILDREGSGPLLSSPYACFWLERRH